MTKIWNDAVDTYLEAARFTAAEWKVFRQRELRFEDMFSSTKLNWEQEKCTKQTKGNNTLRELAHSVFGERGLMEKLTEWGTTVVCRTFHLY
jgi:hypothetical protein